MLIFYCNPASGRASAHRYKTLPSEIRVRHFTCKTIREIRLKDKSGKIGIQTIFQSPPTAESRLTMTIATVPANPLTPRF